VFAGDIVPRKKPAPDIYLLALDSLGLPADRVVVIEDSRNGLLAATGAGVTCMITVNDFTAAEDFSEAGLVVSSLGDPAESTRWSSPTAAGPHRVPGSPWPTWPACWLVAIRHRAPRRRPSRLKEQSCPQI